MVENVDRVSASIMTVASVSQETAAGAEEMAASAHEVSRHSQMVAARNLFRTQRAGVGVLLTGARKVLGQRLFVMGMRRSDGEYVIIVSTEESEQLLSDYARRWCP